MSILPMVSSFSFSSRSSSFAANSLRLSIALAAMVLALLLLLLTPSRAVAQCANIAGNWTATETGTMTLTITASDGESDSETDPIGGTGPVTITKTGTCKFKYTPNALDGSSLLNGSLTPAQIASMVRTVTVSGNNVSETGIFAIVNTAAAEQEGLTISSVNPNTYTGVGTVATNVNPNTMTLKGSGKLTITGSGSAGGQTVSFTITITASTVATFTGTLIPPIVVIPPDQTGIASGLPYSGQFSASGGDGAPFTWCVLSGSTCVQSGSPLPAGFSIDKNSGILSTTGTPAAAQGSYPLTVQATDSGGLTGPKQFTLTIGCPMSVGYYPGGPPSGDGKPTTMNAFFTPVTQAGSGIAAAELACGFIGFNFVQEVTTDAYPPMDAAGNVLSVPYSDPPPPPYPGLSGGYFGVPDSAYPFFWNQNDLAQTVPCTSNTQYLPFSVPIETSDTLYFQDCPNEPRIQPTDPAIAFTTSLVGVLPSGNPSSTLDTWKWTSTFNGANAGGVSQRKSYSPIDPNTGTGGITIASINGVPTPIVTVTPSATNLTTAQVLKVSVTVKGAASTPVPTGSVTLTSGSYTSSATALSKGSATIGVPAGSLAAGSDTLTVVYAPDKASLALFSISTASAEVNVTIPLLTPTVTVTPSLTSLTTGQPLSVAVAVSGPGGQPTPTGTVTISGGGYNSAITSLSNGTATISIPAGVLAVGTDTLTANYAPDTSSANVYYSALGTATVKVAKQTAAATPTFSLAAGTYTANQTVTIKDTTAGAAIFYTTDGTAPTTASAQYSSPVKVGATETIKAIATASGYSASAVGSVTYTINLPPAAAPSFSPAAGTFTAVQTVKLACATSGAAIYYTLDGSIPTTASAKYSAALPVNQTTTIKAIATATGYKSSAVASATYTINLPAATPTFAPPAGTYTSAQTVTLADATSGAVFYYTTNGTTPTASSTKYTAAGIKVSASETIKAIATAAGYSSSAVASATYTIATAPTVTTKAASSLSSSGATLNGTVVANNATTQYWFAWGTSKTSLTNNTPQTGAITGATSTAVTASLTGLKTKTTYYFQAVASNGVGTTNGTVLSFTTN